MDAHRLTDATHHEFYGYYDNPAFSGDDRYHLCHRVGFYDRLPNERDVAELGMIELATGAYVPLAATTRWNFQQGSMLQWHPQSPDDEIIYNACEDGHDCGVVMNVRTHAKRYLDRPVANVDPTGRYALSVNFSRLFDFRPGYGYAGVADRFADANHPAEDGVFRLDLRSGRSRLILSLQQLWEYSRDAFRGEDHKILINHITFNTDGTRFLLLARNFAATGGWKTAMFTANSDGSEVYLLADYAKASHYHWRDPHHIAIWSKRMDNERQGEQLYVLKDRTRQAEPVDPQFFVRDGHCSYSPDRRWLLYDSYPDRNRHRHLYLYDLVKRQGRTLGSYHSDPGIEGDIRCDLHPRWNRAGTAVSFDSIHEGRRQIYTMDLREIAEFG